MAIIIKTEEEIENMKISGKILAETLEELQKIAKAGMSTEDLDDFAENFIIKKGGIPGFKGYSGFPKTLCTCLNEKVVHSIPKKDEIIKEGDLLTIDCGVKYKGMNTDAARSFAIGNTSNIKLRLIKTANIALEKAINIAKPGIRIGEISLIIQKTIESEGFKVIKELTGHGVGRTLHEDPIILNYFDGNMGPILKPGMTLAIEPIFSISTSEIDVLKDGWTIVTKDSSCAVQAENTILITENGSENLTML
ncbi:MAG: type I methionyl aminopeptidase [Candidatus Gracilibacteria bacterium]|jgi:methionyl aminopeptidase